MNAIRFKLYVAGESPRAQQAQLDRIGRASQHPLQNVEGILTYARMGAGREELHIARVELGELVSEVASTMRTLAVQKGLAFELSEPEEPVEIETDRTRTRQILLNLLSNAVKFTDEGSVRAAVKPDGRGPLVRVSDTGVGIPPEHLERIFERFRQVAQWSRRAAGGTRLGLSVARRLATIPGGALNAESRVGKGWTLTLRLPASGPEDPPA